ncbi:MAG: alanine racemase [Terrimonas sp.]|nr:alanine racemase [Terrimonas sp.]
MFETSVIEISKSALQTNLKFLKQRTGPHVKFCSVVKGNAYGHGLSEFVNLSMECGVGYFAVYAADEAYRIVQSIKTPPEIYIMGMVENDALEWAIQEGIEFCVFDRQRLEAAASFAKRIGKKAKIHLEVETGMNRTGLDEKEIALVGERIAKENQFFEVRGVCTHFSGAESMANNFRVSQQISRFYKSMLTVGRSGLKPVYQHAACSAGVMNYPETMGNMVRVGIMQYGFWPNDETFIRYNGDKERNNRILKRLITWKSRIMSMKQVKKGEFIGYGTSFLAHRDMKVATVPIGYSHGYSRNLSNTGKVLVRGSEASVTGIVNMNAITIDITGIDGVEKGDEVVLIGTQKNKTVSVVSFSEMSHQLNYEMLTRLPKDIPRLTVT